MRTYASLDLETTGLDADRDAILEIGIVVFRGNEVLEEWNALIDPERAIPAKITELTGITLEMVQQSAIGLGEGLRNADKIIGNLPVIGHNVGFDLGFMRRHRRLVQNASVDTFELAGILVPHAGRYSLGALAQELGITLPATHRALDDARVAHQLFLRCFERACDLPKETLEEIARIADMSNWTLKDFWRDALEAQERGTFSTTLGAKLKKSVGSKKASLSGTLRRRTQLDAKPLKPREVVEALDVGKVAHLLSNEGPFARQFPGYEAREPQIAMLRKVAETFNVGGDVFIEAGTGTGKSLAYLIPSMMWAIQNGERVVISTNTINLQEQLAEKDVPLVISVLGQEGRAAVMKGKAHYLCNNRLNDLRRNGPRTADEVRVLTKILIWLPTTLTGDSDELFIPSPGERLAFQHLSAQNPLCNLNTCSATDCFFHQARRLAESAHVVIVNHALLLADIAVENRALPEYKYLVVDEAHHLEAAATDSLTFQIDRDEVGRMAGDLGRTVSRKASGLLPDIASKVRSSLSVDKSAPLEALCDKGLQAIGAAWNQFAQLFDEAVEFFSGESQGDSDYSQKIRITPNLRNRSGWSRLEVQFDNLFTDAQGLIKTLNSLYKNLTELGEAGMVDMDVLIAQLNGQVRFFVEVIEQLGGIISKPDDKRIYWADFEPKRGYGGRTRAPKLQLCAAPLHVGPLVKQHLWDSKAAVVMTSATMRAANANNRAQPTFEFIKNRLTAQDADELAVGSPFDYKASTLVYLVTDVPEPNQQGYQQAVERGLIELFRASGGRGLALFTSYSALRQTARVIAPELQKSEIMVYEQGDGVSRRVMVEQFRAAERAVMLGTRSFWEGVDIQGDKLSALAICKLPFDVPTDPIFAARSETFENSFNDYSVPETVLRFRQGFGRLIRSKSDRGVIVILDRRLMSKQYGAAFLNALPGPSIVRAPLSMLEKHVRDWLAKGIPAP
jgi:DNA polymerase-3 subunit epsilon/ATP-dependent DNA helicase DinG